VASRQADEAADARLVQVAVLLARGVAGTSGPPEQGGGDSRDGNGNDGGDVRTVARRFGATVTRMAPGRGDDRRWLAVSVARENVGDLVSVLLAHPQVESAHVHPAQQGPATLPRPLP